MCFNLVAGQGDFATVGGITQELFHLFDGEIRYADCPDLSRIHVWCGDLSEHQLSLPLSAREQLVGRAPKSDNIHAVIHCGALVQYNYDYRSLKGINVNPTAYLPKITAQSSTIGKFLYVSGGITPNFHQRDASTDGEPALTNGYTQSKLVSEIVVRGCADCPAFQGRRIRIIRPGYMIGSAANPTPVQTDFIWRLVAAYLRMGFYNADANSQWLYISDVERVARVVVTAIFEGSHSRIMDAVWDGLPLGSFWGSLTADFGYNLRPLRESHWLGNLRSTIAREAESNPLFPFFHVLEKELKSVGSTANSDMDSASVLDAIRGNIQNLIEAGFLPPPPSSSGQNGGRAVENGPNSAEAFTEL
ncbi:hypothetical protein N7457_005426 [Penicillium paradoxum]|uniref:uncharacterized protein n=1 Tax=Penicillium paradoxum TaxID=176176 RepID=UPI002548DFC4|nr:uncharacterized protein N7457_005426 [Penicillium paradoxum]KAJ5780266.1 hypothetical protein N7457_005426 [Penicillium paradoxum]